jgi:two-component system chemotaxis sensor kinase CheA
MVMRREPDKGEVSELTKEFIAESREGLDRMEQCLTELETRPGDKELVAEIFRAVHTIKGTTGFLGFGRLERLAHAGENLLGALRDGKVAVTSNLISGLLELMDGLKKILRLIEATGSEGLRASDDDSALIAVLADLRAEGASEPAPAPEATIPSPKPPAAPSVQSDDAGPTQADDASPAQAKDPNPPPAAPPPEKRGQPPTQAPLPAPAASIQDRTLRIDVDVLNRLMNLVGELVLTRNQILQITPDSQNFPELSRRLDSVTAELRESVMQARMQPVGHLFSKFPRMVRDLGRTCGRKVRIEFEGQETGLDKSLLEAIRDPLTHAVRNSVDHGIEAPDERLRTGKPAEGVLRLRAFHHGGSVVIEVTDDGAGISTQRILAKAIERGLVTPEQAQHMSEREALQLVFVAGFSTAKEVTSVSGRGVGMDVVRSNVEKVGGSVELESTLGAGTTVRLRVPLTLAIVPALVVRSAGQSFALPQNSLVELVYVPRRDAEAAIEHIGSAELYRLREGLLPLVWLDRLLALEHTEPADPHGFYIAVVESEGHRFGLVVEDLMAPEEIVVKPLSAALREIGVFSGATVLGNGMLAMILDVAATGARAGVRPSVEAAKALSAGAEPLAAHPRPEPAMPQFGMQNSLVIYETWKRDSSDGRVNGRIAMPLSAVERIETVPIDEIEYADGRAILQYRGELLPLDDDDEVLRELSAAARTATAEDEGQKATVLICLRPGADGPRRVGLVVRRVLDVTAGTSLAADASVCDSRLAMVKDRVTPVHRHFAAAEGPAKLVLQEVA